MWIPRECVLLPLAEAGIYDMSEFQRFFLDLRSEEEHRCSDILRTRQYEIRTIALNLAVSEFRYRPGL